MALTDAQKTSLLFKKAQGVAETSTSKQFFEEAYKGRPIMLGNEVWAEAGSIPATAPTLADDATSGVVKYFAARNMTAVPGVANSFFLEDLKDSIPFNFGDGTSYNYVITSSTGTVLNPGANNIIVDNAAGILSFYGTVPSNMPPKITFYKYVGQKGVTTASDVSGELANYIPLTQKAAANGVATLGATSVIPLSQISDLTNAQISATAAIAYSKLNIGNGDIAYSKLSIADADLTIAKTSGLQAALDAKLALAGGTMSGNLAMGIFKVTSSYVALAGTDLVNKTYIDNVLTGIHWKHPADALNVLGTSATDPVGPTAGQAYINTADSHIYYYNGTSWVDQGALVTGMNFVVTGGTAIGAFATHENAFAMWNGTTYDFTAAVDGDSVNVHGGFYENASFQFTGTVWVQINGAGQIAAGVGLGKTGNTFYVKLGAGVTELPTGEVAVDVDGSSLELSDATTDAKVRIKALGVTNAMLAGSIAQSKITGLETDLAAKEPTITAAAVDPTLKYWRGDKSFQVLNTAAVAESVGSLYFTDGRAQTAAVVNTLTGTETVQAPSVSSVKTALNGKSDTGHNHAIADVTGLQTALDGKSATGHGHVAADVSDFTAAAKAATVFDGITNGVLDVAPSQNAVFDALAGKSDTGHGHAISDVSGLSTALSDATAAATWTDSYTNKEASATLVAGNIVYLSAAGQVKLAKADAIATCGTKLAVVTAASIAPDAAGIIMLQKGKPVTITGATFTLGPVFLSPSVAGGLTQTAVATAGQVFVKIGDAISATVFEFNPGDAILIAS